MLRPSRQHVPAAASFSTCHPTLKTRQRRLRLDASSCHASMHFASFTFVSFWAARRNLPLEISNRLSKLFWLAFISFRQLPCEMPQALCHVSKASCCASGLSHLSIQLFNVI